MFVEEMIFEVAKAPMGANMVPSLGLMIGVFMFVGLLFYVYAALTLMFTAKKLNDSQPWLAWIPVANFVLMARLAKMHWWPVLLLIAFLIPILNFVAIIVFTVFMVIWQWKICEARNRPGWWVLLQFIPFFGSLWYLIMWGILAWGE
jgi:hypothetical protein